MNCVFCRFAEFFVYWTARSGLTNWLLVVKCDSFAVASLEPFLRVMRFI